MGDADETSSRYIFDKMAELGIEMQDIVHMPGLVAPISAIMIDPSGERTIITFRDPELWKVRLPNTDKLLEDCDAILTENRCAAFCTGLCAEARRRGIPVVVDVDSAMSMREGLLTASSHLIFSSEALQATADVADDAAALQKLAKVTSVIPCRNARPTGHGVARSERRTAADRRPFRSAPWIRWAPGTCSMARSFSPSPKIRTSRGRSGSPPPRPLSNAPASAEPLPARNALKWKHFSGGDRQARRSPRSLALHWNNFLYMRLKTTILEQSSNHERSRPSAPLNPAVASTPSTARF